MMKCASAVDKGNSLYHLACELCHSVKSKFGMIGSLLYARCDRIINIIILQSNLSEASTIRKG